MSEPATALIETKKQPAEREVFGKQALKEVRLLGTFIFGCVISFFIAKTVRNTFDKERAKEKINWVDELSDYVLDDALAVVGGFIAMCAAWFSLEKSKKHVAHAEAPATKAPTAEDASLTRKEHGVPEIDATNPTDNTKSFTQRIVKTESASPSMTAR